MAHQSSLAAVLEHDLMEVGICDLATFLLMLEHDAAEVFDVIMRNDECRAAALRACQPEQATAACQWESPWEKIKEEEEVSTQTTEEIINLCTAAVTVENITQTTEELEEESLRQHNLEAKLKLLQTLSAELGSACAFVPVKATGLISPMLLERLTTGALSSIWKKNGPVSA